MTDRKSLFLGLVLLLGCFIAAQPRGAIHYFLNVPGARGDVQEPGFEGWIRCVSIQYRLPGIPSPARLLKKPPEQPRGIVLAGDVNTPFITISKSMDQSDLALQKAYEAGQRFPEWKLVLCTAAGKTYMTFILRGVKVSSIGKKTAKQYLTFKYEKLLWYYTPIKK